MRRLNSFALALSLALSLASAPGRACAPAPPLLPTPASPPAAAPLPSVTLPPDFDRVLRDYEAAWQRRDAGALADLFAEDGFVLALRRGAGGRWLIMSDMDNPNHPPRRMGPPEVVR